MKVDWLIVGAGFTGAVLAERIACVLDQKVLLLDKRPHIAGNAYDCYDEYGVLVHQYGPHIFHTNARYIWEYLGRFTQWRAYQHKVLGAVEGRLVPIPFNLNAIDALFPVYYAERLAKRLIEHYGCQIKVPILKLRESSDADLKFLADYIYENVFRHYTLKQWDLPLEALDPAVTERVPIHISRDDRYFQDTYQGTPAQGYTALFQRMLHHPNIRLLLNTPHQDIDGEIQYQHMVYTGRIDEFFKCKHGALPYRSLDFKRFYERRNQLQPVGTLNYPNEYLYTRTTEFKHLTGQQCHGTSWIEEYPQPYIPNQNEPYYPIPRESNRILYRRYQEEAQQAQVIFAGRLGDYQYYNMDQAVARALSLFEKKIKPS